MSRVPHPERKSIQQRIAALKEDPNPLVETDLHTLGGVDSETATFSVGESGELTADLFAPLPVVVERAGPTGILDTPTASAYHLLLTPESVTPEDVEALAVSVWSEAGWLSPGVLQLQENVTLEGPWTLDDAATHELGVPEDIRQVWLLRCSPRRGSKPSAAVQAFDDWAKAFPDGMPIGIEAKVLDVLRRMSRRLGGAVRVAGSGAIIQADSASSIALRVLTDTWLPPSQVWTLLSAHLENVSFAHQSGDDTVLSNPEQMDSQVPTGMPYALLVDVSASSQVLIGVRQETFIPRALRWEAWAKPPLTVHEIVWVSPDDLSARHPGLPSRRGRLERSRAESIAETAAASIATAVPHSAIIDEDGFLLALDEPLQEEEPPRP